MEQCEELQLTEVMKMKMHLIHFVAVMNLSEMTLMKMLHTTKNSLNSGFQYHIECQSVMHLKNDEAMGEECHNPCQLKKRGKLWTLKLVFCEQTGLSRPQRRKATEREDI
jgi:hypothetical protein